MGDERFLFEFAFRSTVEQIMKGEWCRKNLLVQLQWWSALIGAINNSELPSSVWTRLVGLPLQSWPQKAFQSYWRQLWRLVGYGGDDATSESLEMGQDKRGGK